MLIYGHFHAEALCTIQANYHHQLHQTVGHEEILFTAITAVTLQLYRFRNTQITKHLV